MRLIKIGLANINPTVGAFTANVDQCIEAAQALASEDVTIALFPEQVVGGYTPEDLVQWQGFVDGQFVELERFAAATSDLQMVSVMGAALANDGLRYNCAVVISGGQLLGIVPKQKLPTYNIFYEGRTISRGLPLETGELNGVPFGDLIFRFDFGTVAVEVCEDLWSPDGPIGRRTYAGAELVCNISGSPYRVGVQDTRRELISTRAADHQCTIAYVNMVGANDGLIFDGGSYVNQNGKAYLDGPRFQRGYTTQVVDLDRTMRLRAENTTWRDDRGQHLDFGDLPERIDIPETVVATADTRARLTYPVPTSGSFFLPAVEPELADRRSALFEDILDALALGVGDYFEKNRAFKVIGVSLSGGRDSLLTLLIAHRYATKVRPEDPGALLRAFYQPSRYSSDETR
ncbi:MAG: NAD(+) synthase, partial [Chloroflexota bacterium]|nr:NAD(+) synthase [Chloroflexota bacterium]